MLKPTMGQHSKPSFTAAPQGLLGGGITAIVYGILHHFHVLTAGTTAMVAVALSAAAVVYILAYAVILSRNPARMAAHWTNQQ